MLAISKCKNDKFVELEIHEMLQMPSLNQTQDIQELNFHKLTSNVITELYCLWQ